MGYLTWRRLERLALAYQAVGLTQDWENAKYVAYLTVYKHFVGCGNRMFFIPTPTPADSAFALILYLSGARPRYPNYLPFNAHIVHVAVQFVVKECGIGTVPEMLARVAEEFADRYV